MKLLLLIFATLLFTSCFNYRRDKVYIFPASQQISNFGHLNDARFTPTDKEVDIAEKLMLDAADTDMGFLGSYYQQIVGYIDKDGHKILYINAFCNKKSYWKKDIVVVFDGGNCYFNIKIDLNTQKAFDLWVNGMA